MKNIVKYSLLIVAALTMGSCADWLDVNEDPNNPANVPAEFLLPAAQASVAGIVGGDFAIIGGLWSQHWTQAHASSQYKTIDAYDLTPASYDVAWQELYSGGLKDFEAVKIKAQESGNNILYLQAVAVQTYGLQMLADWFDQIPLSQAFQFDEIKSPVYDNGQAVYAELIKRLDAALALDFTNEESELVTSDLVFGNLKRDEQLDSWIRFVNTLKLKMYLRQTSTSSPTRTQAIAALQSMLTSGTPFLTKAAAIVSFKDEPNRSNPLYENNVRQLNTGDNLRLSYTFQSYLESHDDEARLNAYFTAGTTGQYGLDQGDYNHSTVALAPAVVSIAKMTATDPFYFFSLDEVHFLLAEAYALTGNSFSAENSYNAGVTAAYAKFGLTPGGSYPPFPDGGTVAQQQEAIIMQKWVAMFRQGYESFWDQARTGYPKYSSVGSLDPDYVPGEWSLSVNAVTITFPKRILYTSASRDVNPNTPSAKKVTDKVWWMP